MSPQEDRIGRCCKVGKETILGLLKALEIFVNQDFDATLKIYDERAQVITDAIKKFGVAALPRQFNPQALRNVTPRYSWQIPAELGITGPEAMQKLADTRPLGIGSMGAGARDRKSTRLNSSHPSISYAVFCLKKKKKEK